MIRSARQNGKHEEEKEEGKIKRKKEKERTKKEEWDRFHGKNTLSWFYGQCAVVAGAFEKIILVYNKVDSFIVNIWYAL